MKVTVLEPAKKVVHYILNSDLFTNESFELQHSGSWLTIHAFVWKSMHGSCCKIHLYRIPKTTKGTADENYAAYGKCIPKI